MSNQVTYREPVIVICINTKHSIKLIAGATYYAMSMTSYRDKKTVYLKDVGIFDSSFFTLLNGNPLYKEQDFIVKDNNILNTFINNYKGQFVKCRVNTVKSLKINEIYYVEDQIQTRYISKYNNKSYPLTKLKIRGIERALSPQNFQEISIAEQRNIKLKNINGDKIFDTEQKRKFLQYDEKEKTSILIETLSKVLIDVNKIISSKNKLNLTKLMLVKGVKHSLIADDINDFLTPDMKKLLAPYDFIY